MDPPVDTRQERWSVINRSRIAVAGALAMLTVAVLVVTAVGSDEDQEGTSVQVKPGTPLVGAEGSAFAFGRGATDPAAAATNAASKATSSSELDATRLSDVKACALLDHASVTSAIGSRWTASPSAANGTPQCRWWVDRQPPRGQAEAEVKVTVSDQALYEQLSRLRAESLADLGDEARISRSTSGAWVAVRTGGVTVFVALSSAARSESDDAVTLTREALAGLRGTSAGFGKG